MHYALFAATDLIAIDTLANIVTLAHSYFLSGTPGPLLVFDNRTGRVVDLDLRGSASDAVRRLSQDTNDPASAAPDAPAKRGRGRPKLGVDGRQVTLMPKHWDWLRRQPRSASATLRLLVEQAMRATSDQATRQRALDATYAFLSVVAGDLPGYEDACRYFFRADWSRFEQSLAKWPLGVQQYVGQLMAPIFQHD